jgi:hypothetical protein
MVLGSPKDYPITSQFLHLCFLLLLGVDPNLPFGGQVMEKVMKIVTEPYWTSKQI